MPNQRKIYKEHLSKKNPNIKDDLDGFDKESMEGWQSLSNVEEKFEEIMLSLDKKIDAITEPSSSKENKIKPSIKWFAIAASILLLIGVSFYVFENRTTPEQNLYASYFSPMAHPDAPVRGSENTSLSEVEYHAMTAYEAEDYKKAVNYYETLFNEYPRNTKNALFLSISYLGVNNPTKAIQVLSRIDNVEENYKSDISWYLALAYLKNNEKNSARIILDGLTKEDNFYTESAQEILKALSK